MKSHPFHARQEAEPEVAGRFKKKKKRRNRKTGDAQWQRLEAMLGQ